MRENDLLFRVNNEILDNLALLLEQILPIDYTEISPVFQSSSIGQHVRHIIELYQCLLEQSSSGAINYDLRKRNHSIESDPLYALQIVKSIQSLCPKPDKALKVVQEFENTQLSTISSYSREILYNLEHCIHHQALIKLACQPLVYISLPIGFGVAKSTQAYQMSSYQ